MGFYGEWAANATFARVIDFGEWGWISLSHDIEEAQFRKQQTLPVVISSYGGEVYNLWGMIDMLQESGLRIVTIGIGKIMSAGSILFSIGEERHAPEHSTFMIHNTQGYSVGDMTDMKVSAKEAERMSIKGYKCLDTKTGNKKGYFEELVKGVGSSMLFLDCKTAKKHKLVTHIDLPSLKDVFGKDSGSELPDDSRADMKILMSLNDYKKYDRFPVKRKNQIIFSAGVWKGDEYSNKRVERMFENYQELKYSFTPVIKETHQGIYKVGQYDELYLDKSGDEYKISCDYSTNEFIGNKQDSGELDNVSIEFIPKLEGFDGKIYHDVISGLALQGAEHPELWKVPGIKNDQYSLENELAGYKYDKEKLLIFNLEDLSMPKTIGNVKLDGVKTVSNTGEAPKTKEVQVVPTEPSKEKLSGTPEAESALNTSVLQSPGLSPDDLKSIISGVTQSLSDNYVKKEEFDVQKNNSDIVFAQVGNLAKQSRMKLDNAFIKEIFTGDKAKLPIKLKESVSELFSLLDAFEKTEIELDNKSKFHLTSGLSTEDIASGNVNTGNEKISVKSLVKRFISKAIPEVGKHDITLKEFDNSGRDCNGVLVTNKDMDEYGANDPEGVAFHQKAVKYAAKHNIDISTEEGLTQAYIAIESM